MEKADRAQTCLIHCITNPISINQTANAVLALGAKPIMAEHPLEVEEITKTISASASKNVNIISGICTKHGMGDKLSVTVIATGFDSKEESGIPSEEHPAWNHPAF